MSPSRQRRLLFAAAMAALLAGCAQNPTAVSSADFDPLTPNWSIEEARLPDDRVHFQLSMKRFYIGGAGEARAVFNRRVKALMREGGYSGYEIVEYSEALDSSGLGSKRTAEGVVRFIRTRG